jgi:hypothetical protein
MRVRVGGEWTGRFNGKHPTLKSQERGLSPILVVVVYMYIYYCMLLMSASGFRDPGSLTYFLSLSIISELFKFYNIITKVSYRNKIFDISRVF